MIVSGLLSDGRTLEMSPMLFALYAASAFALEK
jgi:hypothetical protein